jgi:hypothetical protein
VTLPATLFVHVPPHAVASEFAHAHVGKSPAHEGGAGTHA